MLSQDPVFIGAGVDEKFNLILRDPQLQNSYGYGRNNPLLYKDPNGELAFIALFAIGAVANMGLQAVEDYAAGQFSGWESYAGAAVGGMAGVGSSIVSKNPVFIGSVSSGVEEGVKQSLERLGGKSQNYNSGEVMYKVAEGGLFSKYGTPKIAGLNQGRNNVEAVSRSTVTKLSNGTNSNFSAKTGSKIALDQMSKGTSQAVFSGASNNKNLSNKTNKNTYNSMYRQLVSIQKQIDDIKRKQGNKKR